MFSFSSCIAVAVAAVPALVTWWEYRRLASGGESAVLTERVALVRSRVTAASGIAAALVFVAFADAAWWAVPLLLVALAAASHGPRKFLFGETWPFGRYLEWRARVIAGTLGFWILLALTPSIAAATPRPFLAWVTAILFVVLLTWHHFYQRILLVVLGATPLERSDLDPFFAPIFRRTTAIVPTLWRAGAHGGVFANALALPATGQGRVLFFDTLLERLAPAEVAAILAHEVAHLEHFHARLLRRTYVATAAAIAIVVGASAALAAWAPASGWMASALCPVVVFVGLTVRARRMQAEETNSDRRAVALCDDPEALVSALTRLHEIHHVPRRVSPDVEQRATHPSLARRIRAIREHAIERPAEPLLAPAVLVSSEPGRLAILEPERFTLVWAAPDAAGLLDDPIGVAKRIEARAYDQLSELRLSTDANGSAVLTARSIDGARWTVPLRAGEAARAQSALNVVDQLLAAPSVVERRALHRAVAVVTLATTAILETLWPIAVPALLALARPTRQLYVTLACALLATAFITGGDSRLGALRVLALALLSAAAMWQSHRATTKDRATLSTRVDAVRIEGAVIALPIVLGLAWVVAASGDLFGLHTTLRDTAWPTASVAALTAYLATSHKTAMRRAAAGAALLTAAAMFAGSSAFLTRVVRDPLVADAPELVEQAAALTPVLQTTVPGEFEQVRLASDGQHFLLSQDPDDEEGTRPRRHVIGGFDGWSRPVTAADAAIVDENRVLLLDRAQGDTQLRAERFRGTAGPSWALKVRGVDAFRIGAAPDGRWHVIDRHRNAFTRVDGRIGTASTWQTNWDVDAAPQEYVSLQAGSGHVGMGLAVAYRAPILPWWLTKWNWNQKTSILRVDGDTTSRVVTSSLNVSCADAAAGVSGYVCVAFDGRWSRFWRYDVNQGHLHPIGRARGQFFVTSQGANATVAATRAGSIVAIDLAGGRITTFMLTEKPLVMAYHLTDRFLAASSVAGNETTVTLYRLPWISMRSEALAASAERPN